MGAKTVITVTAVFLFLIVLKVLIKKIMKTYQVIFLIALVSLFLAEIPILLAKIDTVYTSYCDTK